MKVIGTGENHNGITVVSDTEIGSMRIHRNVVALCHCGKIFSVRIASLRSGNTKSCGCARAKKSRGFHREYNIWKGMIARCTDKRHRYFFHYGARGIWVCDGWIKSFNNFISDMGPSNGLSLDRIDNSLGYSPENCRWATMHEQQNNRTVTTFITFDGKTLPLAQWARSIGVRVKTLRARLARGWSVEKALTTKGKS